MYRIQVWDEVKRAYFDAHVVSDGLGPTGFRAVSAGCPATEVADGDEALRICDELGSAAEVVCCALNLSTGKRHFDEGTLPDGDEDEHARHDAR